MERATYYDPAIGVDADDDVLDIDIGEVKESSWSTILVTWTIILGLGGLLFFYNNFSQTEKVDSEQQRAQIAEARLRALEQRRGLALTENEGDNNNKKENSEASPSQQKDAIRDEPLQSANNETAKASDSIRGADHSPDTPPEPKVADQQIVAPEVPHVSSRPPVKDDNNGLVERNDEPIIKATKRKNRQPPPAQLVCEALSSVMDQGIHVTFGVKEHPEAASWGGTGWWKSSSTAATNQLTKATIHHHEEMPLHAHYQPEREDDWEYLCETIQQLSYLSDPQSFGSHYLSQQQKQQKLHPLMITYNKASWMSRHGHAPFLLPNHSGFPAFSKLLKGLKETLVAVMAHLLVGDSEEPGSTNNQHDDDDLFDDNGLFSDDYDPSIPSSAMNETKTAVSETPWDELIHLLVQEPPSFFEASLLSEMARVYHDAVPNKNRKSMSTRIIQRLFQELSNEPNVHQMTKWLVPLKTHSKFLVNAWLETTLQREVEILREPTMTGLQIEDHLLLTPLIRTAALVLEHANNNDNKRNRWTRQLQKIDNFPVCVFARPQSEEFLLYYGAYRHMGVQAQAILQIWIKLAIKDQKETFFEWIYLLLFKNQSMVSVPKSDLLTREEGSTLADCSSCSFLLGLASSWLHLCCPSLMERFDSVGLEAFDRRYLVDEGKHALFFGCSNASGLFGKQDEKTLGQTMTTPPSYAGWTHLYFLGASLLHTALHPAMKMEREFYQVHSRVIEVFRKHAARQEQEQQAGTLPPQFVAEGSARVATFMGWRVFLEEPEFVVNATGFSLLELKWALELCRAKTAKAESLDIPDWLVKDPSRFLAKVAHGQPHLLKPSHAEKAVEYCTELLDLGYATFSPIVVTCLLRVASSFIHAGVNRARQRLRARKRGGALQDDDFNDRELDIYLSLDKNDLGVTVFTNPLVSTRLCPTLIKVFHTLDFVEGLDMDTEYDFDKFNVKTEIADLLLRLWCHPNGQSRQSVVDYVDASDLQLFVSSLISAFSVFFDDAVQKIGTSLKTLQQPETTEHDEQFAAAHTLHAAGGLSAARRLLLLLCTLSQEEKLSAVIGGAGDGPSEKGGMYSDIANMVVHFIDILTEEDGGTSSSLELDMAESTISLYERASSMSKKDLDAQSTYLVKSRQFVISQTGLNVSMMCYQFLALLAGWHHAAKKTAKSGSGSSHLLTALACHDDLSSEHWLRVYDRLVVPTIMGTGTDSESVFFNDGYYLAVKSSCSPPTEMDETRRRYTKQDQPSYDQIEQMLGSHRIIKEFLVELGDCIRQQRAETSNRIMNASELEAATLAIMAGPEISEDEYSGNLGDYLVSSSPFSNSDCAAGFYHYYGKAVKSRSSTGSGKGLVKEARKCQKLLPSPHADSSCFICFAEERMDLCKAVVTGPIGTPYAHGIFVFDIYFPPNYPQIPPLVTFMTTGGGQVRFSPNLYVDGKVCLSLLGLTFSRDETQRWNPDESSLGQILLSLQAQVFGSKDPYFNEGSGIPEQQRHTPAGKEGSRKHNNMLRLATLRHAVVAQMQSPPLGFEEVVHRHFSLCKKRVLCQARRWTLEAKGTPLHSRFEKVFSELVGLLGQEISFTGSLPPLREDVEILKVYDPSFHVTGMKEIGTAPEPVLNGDAAFNPWADPSSYVLKKENESSAVGKDDSDDELYS